MSNLYVIGNGFDLFHGLKTSYADFNEYLNTNEIDFGETAEFFEFSADEEGLWKDFENDLSSFDVDSYFDYHNEVDVTREDFRTSEVYGLEDELSNQSEYLVSSIQEAFTDWIGSVEINTKYKINAFTPSDVFLSFNYTPTLQTVYSIENERIFHIHGFVSESAELIFGHGLTITQQPEVDENGDSLRTMFTDAEGNANIPLARLQKPVHEVISQHEKFFHNLNGLQNIFVLGHSLSDVDLPYFERISQNNPDAAWKISYYADDEQEKFRDQLLKAGVAIEKIDFIKIDDLCR